LEVILVPGKQKQAEFTPEEEKELADLEKMASETATEVEQSSGSESAPEEPKAPSKEKEPEPQAPEEGGVELSDEEVALLSAKAQKRFHKLSQKAKEADKLQKELEELREKEEAQPGESPLREHLEGKEPELPEETPPVGSLPWETPGGQDVREVTPEEYGRDVTSTARLIVQEELSRERRLMHLSEDIKTAEGKYPELNPESGSYDEDLTTSITEWYGKLSKADPTLRLLPFVEKLMSLRSKGAEQEKSKVTAKVAKQAAKQAVSPAGAPTKAQGLEDVIQSAKSLEELEQAAKSLPHA
jgi:hypothetical protein